MKRMTIRPLHLVAVAALAFIAGRLGFPPRSDSVASAQVGEREHMEPRPATTALVDTSAPGRFHRHLDQLIGAWEGEWSIRTAPDAPPAAARGTVTREWILGGRYIRETVKAESDAGHVEGLSFIGFNAFDRRYEVVWMDNMSTAIEYETGTYHPDEKILHVAGGRRDPVSGRLINSWGKLNLADPDRQVYTGYSTDEEGRTFKAVEGVLERKR